MTVEELKQMYILLGKFAKDYYDEQDTTKHLSTQLVRQHCYKVMGDELEMALHMHNKHTLIEEDNYYEFDTTSPDKFVLEREIYNNGGCTITPNKNRLFVAFGREKDVEDGGGR